MPNRAARRNNARQQNAASQSLGGNQPNRAGPAGQRTLAPSSNRNNPAGRPSQLPHASAVNRSSLGGLDVRIAAPLCYIIPALLTLAPFFGNVSFVIPLLIFFIEARSAFVRFHALQAAIYGVISTLILIPLSYLGKWYSSGPMRALNNWLGFAGSALMLLLMLSVSIVLIVLFFKAIWRARREDAYRMPVIGRLTERAADLLGRSIGR